MKETPEEHVTASTKRQRNARKSVAEAAKQVAKEAEDKAAILAKATDLLSSRVGTLADAVQMNNHKIDQLQREINCKPDDVEVKLITGMATAERQRHLKWATITAVISSILAGGISFWLAERNIEERTRQANIACERNNARAEVSADVYDDVRKAIARGPVADRLREAADELRKTLADCDALHPVSLDDKGKPNVR